MSKLGNTFSLALSTLGIVLILATLTLLTIAVQNAEQFNLWYRPLLVLALVGLAVVLLVVAVTFTHLYRQHRQGLSGSKLRTKFIGLFIIASVLPLIILYAFSVKLLDSGIDSWFDIRISEALNNSYELGQTAIDERKKRLLREAYFTANKITDATLEHTVLEMQQSAKADEVSVITDSGAILTFSHADPATLVPNMPDESTMTQVKSGVVYHELENRSAGKRYIRIVVPIAQKLSPAEHANQDKLLDSNLVQAYLNALFPVPERIEQLLSNVNQTSSGFRQISFLQPQLRQSMIITLSMVLFIALIGSIWLSFYLAGRLAQPIMQLAKATKAVSDGNYQQHIRHTQKDELGFLVNSFNQMTNQIDQSQQQIKGQHAYLDTVLNNMSSGVLTTDQTHTIQRYNRAAENILGISLKPHLGQHITSISASHLRESIDTILQQLNSDNENWEKELHLNDRQATIRLHAQSLPEQAGTIVVIDDISEVIRGQRNAAWSEVAQRLAHEIKNPLTPIQLAADRIRTKFIPAASEDTSHILDKSTHTIIAQVDALKHMVEEFSDYARAPQLQRKTFALPAFLEEFAELYRGMPAVEMSTTCTLPQLHADPSKLRQVLHNLVKNSVEASLDHTKIHIQAQADAGSAQLRICDNSGGIAPELLPTVFEPYVTSKEKGTGIGLAIVKRIIEEHGGRISAQNVADGVCFTLQLPQQPP